MLCIQAALVHKVVASCASWDTHWALVLLTCNCGVLETRQRTAPPVFNPRVTSHPNTCLFSAVVSASGCRLQTEQTRPCECVIRIVNEVNSSAHLTSLQLSLVQHHGTLRCYIMGNDWLQILHQSTGDLKGWCFFFFMLIFLLDLCLCWGQFYDQAGSIEYKKTKIYP